MMSEEELDIELIEGYFNKTLTPGQLQQFEERVREDTIFAEKVADYNEIIKGVRQQAASELLKEIGQWEKEITGEERNSFNWKLYVRLAAAILLIAVVAFYFLYPAASENETDIFTAYFTPYEDVISVRDGAPDKETLASAMTFYRQGDYKEAIPFFSTVLITRPDDTDALFYMGTSWLAMKNTTNAIPLFEKVIDQDNVYRDQAEWYLALAYLLNNDLLAAHKLIDAMSTNSSHSFHQQSKEIKGILKD